VVVVKVAATLQVFHVGANTFDDAATQAAFIAGLAKYLDINPADISIVSYTIDTEKANSVTLNLIVSPKDYNHANVISNALVDTDSLATTVNQGLANANIDFVINTVNSETNITTNATYESVDEDDSHYYRNVGLGVGLGLGIPLLAIAGYTIHRRRQRRRSRVHGLAAVDTTKVSYGL